MNEPNTPTRAELARDLYVAMVGGVHSTQFRPSPTEQQALASKAFTFADSFLAEQARQEGKR